MSITLFTLVLFAAGVLGGAINAVAGGGSFIVFPTMLLGGIGPVIANATTAAGLWVAGIGSVGAYRREIPRERKLLLTFSVASATGGALGAALLLVTSDQTFAKILPLLMLAAALVFTFGPRVMRARDASRRLPLAAAALLQLLISTYGGYFGGGMGIMMLAVYTLMGMTNIHEMNAMKVIYGLLINGVAVAGFLVAGKVTLAVAAPVSVGAIVGGWGGAWLARRTDRKYVRMLVLAIAWSLTVWFSYRALLK